VLDVLSAVTIGRLDAAEVREFVHTFDRTNGRAYSTMFRPSVCCRRWRMYCGQTVSKWM